MKSLHALILAASIALAGAQQLTYNASTRTFTCPVPDAAYCAGGDSRSTSIIIRCVAAVAHPTNCSDRLAAEFPAGASFAPCVQSSPYAGDAACAKNCVIYGASGNYRGPLRLLPDCTPAVPPGSSVARVASASGTNSSKTATAFSLSPSSSSSSSLSLSSPPKTNTTTSSSLTTNTTSTASRPPPPPSSSSTRNTLLLTTARSQLTAPSAAPSPSSLRNATSTAAAASTNALRTTSRPNVPVGPTTAAAAPMVFTSGAAAGARRAGVVGAALAVLACAVLGMWL